MAVDVTVSQPSQSSPIIGDGTRPVASASERAALDKVALKNNKYRAQCEQRGAVFQAVAVCSFGGWLKEGQDLVEELANRCAGRLGQDPGIVAGQYWQRLGVALWRGNARQILHCLA